MDSIERTLDYLLNTMYVKSALFIGIGRALGGLGSLMYIFIRVWGHLARNEEIEVTPLFRPVALAACLMFYGAIAGSVMTVNKSLSEGTEVLVTSELARVKSLMREKKRLLDQANLRLSTELPALTRGDDGSNNVLGMLMNADVGNWISTTVVSQISEAVDKLLIAIGQALYNTAGILIKFLQTFFLLVLLITGPITIGLACFEWFYGGLASWVGRIIHLILWLPLVNIIGGMLERVHVAMLEVDIAQFNNTPGDVFTKTDVSLLAFYIMGTVAYAMVPTAASWVVESSGVGGAVTKLGGGLKSATGAVGGGAGAAAGVARASMKSAASLGSRMQNGI